MFYSPLKNACTTRIISAFIETRILFVPDQINRIDFKHFDTDHLSFAFNGHFSNP